MLASQGASQLAALTTSIVIAHLLSPHQVGLAAEAIVFGTLALVVTDFGIGSVIVQRPQLSAVDTSTAFWASIGLGAFLTAAGIGLSWPIASLYGQPEVQPLFATLSLTFVLTAPGVVQGALLSRELQFRALEIRGILSTATACATAIVFAGLGFGPWAIIIQSLTVSAVSTALLWRSSSWRPQMVFSSASLREFRGFATHVFGARSLSWAVLNVDNLLVGRFLGAAALGAYSMACSVALAPLNRIALPIGQVFFPAFSRIEDRRRIATAWLRGLRMVALIVVPIMLGAVITAPDLILVLFGRRWHAAVPVLQLLGLVGLMQALTALNGGILQGIGEGRRYFRCTLLISGASVAAFAAGIPWGITGVALSYLLVSAVVQPIFTVVTARAVGASLAGVMHSISGVLQAGTGMLLIVFVERTLMVGHVAPAPRLLVFIVSGAVSYLVLVAWRAPEVRSELEELWRRRTGAAALGAPVVAGGES
jgi:O-antigen/teichoic acid export membrane protein